MSQCQGKRGFYTLYDCGKRAVGACSVCERSLCGEHLSNSGVCYECIAASKQAQENLNVRPYAMRHRMYLNKNFQPVHFGIELSSYYDQYDVDSFNIELASIADMAGSPDELFYDS